MVLWEVSVAGEREGDRRNQVPVDQDRTVPIGPEAIWAEKSVCLSSPWSTIHQKSWTFKQCICALWATVQQMHTFLRNPSGCSSLSYCTQSKTTYVGKITRAEHLPSPFGHWVWPRWSREGRMHLQTLLQGPCNGFLARNLYNPANVSLPKFWILQSCILTHTGCRCPLTLKNWNLSILHREHWHGRKTH